MHYFSILPIYLQFLLLLSHFQPYLLWVIPFSYYYFQYSLSLLLNSNV